MLITGAGGGVGHLAVQLAKHLGATVVGVACSTSKVDFVRSLGADDVIDYTAEDLDARGRDYDVILDTGGGRKVAELLSVLKPDGRLVLVGGEGGGPMLRSVARLFTARDKRAKGLMASTTPRRIAQSWPGSAAEGALAPHVDRVMPLSQGAAAIDLMAAARSRGKIVLVPWHPVPIRQPWRRYVAARAPSSARGGRRHASARSIERIRSASIAFVTRSRISSGTGESTVSTLSAWPPARCRADLPSPRC